jgi:allene oxide cyclase
MRQVREVFMVIQIRCAAFVAAGLVAFACITPAAAADVQSLKLVEHATTDTVTDTGDEDDSVGDILTFANPIFDEANKTQLGSDNGWCVRTVVGSAWECFWTLTLKDGQITVEGPYFDAADSSLAVTGGTGAYSGVKGEMKLHARNPDQTEYDFVYSLVR